MGVVQNAVQGEIECFNLLQKALSEIAESVAALDSFFKDMGGDTTAFSSLNDNLNNITNTFSSIGSDGNMFGGLQ